LEVRLETGDVPGRSGLADQRNEGHRGVQEVFERLSPMLLAQLQSPLREILQAVTALATGGQETRAQAIRQTMIEALHEVLPLYFSRLQADREGLTKVLPQPRKRTRAAKE
jgi:hypothetical protein